MSVSVQRLRRLGRGGLIAVDLVIGAAIMLVAAGIWLESGWIQPTSLGASEAFRHGTIGTELLPVPVAEVLSDLSPLHFQSRRADGSVCQDWVECLGFSPGDKSVNDGFPVGFEISNYRPRWGAASPVAFVGFSCALCHTTALRTSTGSPPIIVSGPGSASLNLFAWLDAMQ